MAHIFKGDFSVLENRKKILPPRGILSRLGIRKGSRIIDFGCGIGYFSIPALEFTGKEGKVTAIDISDRMLDELRKRAKGLKNLEIVKSDTIKGFRGDIILLSNMLHEVDNPKGLLEDCSRALNQDGRVIVIDWQKKETGIGPPIPHRIAKEEAIGMWGGSYVEHEIDDAFYFLEMKK